MIMGIVNVTPDSFSDGGCFFETGQAVEHGLRLAAEGADFLDVGGESTRPGASSVSLAEELRRVLPVIETLREQIKTPISIDTQKPEVARRAIEAGAVLINDIAGNRIEPEMWEIAARTGAAYVLMHIKGTPHTMHLGPKYDDVVAEVDSFFEARIKLLQAHGLALEQILLDPGLGFGKTAEHNFQLLAGINRFRLHERPVLLGASRKSFIGKLLGNTVNDRLPGSLACAAWAVLNHVQMIRTHDVAATLQAVRLIEQIQAHTQARSGE
jgi:dihydropteroate synthase